MNLFPKKIWSLNRLYRLGPVFILCLVVIAVFIFVPIIVRLIFWILILSSYGQKLSRRYPINMSAMFMFITVFVLYSVFFKVGSLVVFPAMAYRNAVYYLSWSKLQAAEIEKIQTIISALFFPKKNDFIMTTSFLVLWGLFGRFFSKYCLRLCPNPIFEFAAYFPNTVLSKIFRYVQFAIYKVFVGFLLVAIALYFLQFQNVLFLALFYSLLILVPYLGTVLGGLFLLFFVPESSNIVFQIVGLLISCAVVWFIQFLIFENQQKHLALLYNFPMVLVILIVGFLIFGISILPFIVPLYLMCTIFIETFLISVPLLKSPFNRLQKILTA